jgi:hypothetical protein
MARCLGVTRPYCGGAANVLVATGRAHRGSAGVLVAAGSAKKAS